MARKQRIDVSHGKSFTDLLDTYEDEFPRWTRTDLVRGLVGVYEIGEQDFNALTMAEQLQKVGCPYPLVPFRGTKDGDSDQSQVKPDGLGYIATVRDQYNKIRPVIVLHREIAPETDSRRADFPHVIRLLLLMQLMGYAENISKGIDYDAETNVLDSLAAKVYSHLYVCRHAKKLNYRVALAQYLINIDKWRKSESELERSAAEQFVQATDMEALKSFGSLDFVSDTEETRRQLVKIGRFDEFMRKNKAKL